MIIILRKLSQTTDEDFSFIHAKSAEGYLKNFGNSEEHKVNFRQKFSHIDVEIVKILEQLL